MQELTERQTQLVAAMERFHAERGSWPTIRELADLHGVSLNAVHECLEACERKGAVEHTGLGSRSWRPTKPETVVVPRCVLQAVRSSLLGLKYSPALSEYPLVRHEVAKHVEELGRVLGVESER